MTDKIFINAVKTLIANYFNNNVDVTDGKKITTDDVYIVWSCKTLQNFKALASTTVSDGMYYEITYLSLIHISKNWIDYEVKMHNLSVDEQIAAYQRMDDNYLNTLTEMTENTEMTADELQDVWDEYCLLYTSQAQQLLYMAICPVCMSN